MVVWVTSRLVSIVWIVSRRTSTIITRYVLVLDYALQTVFQLNAIQYEIFIFTIAHHVIHANDVLFVGILRTAHNRCARLDPCEATVFVHDAIIVSQYLAFVDNWKNREGKIFINSLQVRLKCKMRRCATYDLDDSS